MQFDANLAPARANPLNGRASSSIAGEIDLYDELLAFVEMSPEEQRLYLSNPESDTKSVNDAPEAVEKVDLETSSPIESLVVDTKSMPLNEKIEAIQAVVELSAVSDPLVDLNLDGVLTAVQNGKECLSCGVASAADDLFCMNCGGFLNGVASGSPANPTCADCSLSISADEIFCPWCGSVLAAS